jgi:hypothetical protein
MLAWQPLTVASRGTGDDDSDMRGSPRKWIWPLTAGTLNLPFRFGSQRGFPCLLIFTFGAAGGGNREVHEGRDAGGAHRGRVRTIRSLEDLLHRCP